jgi:hypothetical protein
MLGVAAVLRPERFDLGDPALVLGYGMWRAGS